MELTLYTRSECHLCEVMSAALAPHAGALGFTVHKVDVDSDPELARRYGRRVPVLTDAQGGEICHHALDEKALRHRLAVVR